MNVSAIVVVGGDEGEAGQFAGIPLPLFDVLGRSVLVRVLERLDHFGIVNKVVIIRRGLPLPTLDPTVRIVTSDQDALWETAIRLCSEARNNGVDVVLALNLGPYLEMDYDELIRYHLRQRLSITAAVDQNGRCAMTFACTALREPELTYLLRHRLRTVRRPHAVFRSSGYSNDLAEVPALRRLAVDAFCGNAMIAPNADEVKPGVWISRSASVHPRARIVAPAYIGEHAKIRASAIVTRCSVVEHHAEVGIGVVLENATVLPSTIIGQDLDITHAIVGLRRLFHLGRSIEVEINEKRFVRQVSTAPVRFFEQLASLAAYLPGQFLRGVAFPRAHGSRLQERSVQSPHSALASANHEELSGDLAGVRRYGED